MLDNIIALFQQLQLPLQHCRGQQLGEVAQLRYHLLKALGILSSLQRNIVQGSAAERGRGSVSKHADWQKSEFGTITAWWGWESSSDVLTR